jgi:GAF domain-containing protein/DNA-binding NarL/FixJ family response regulator/anti-sigma regulatory factor (Ser/Thr protein kinase)
VSPRPALRDRPAAKILHIEDNPDNRMLVRALLEAEGYTVVEAEDGLAGIEAALREQPALILLDINLPGVDGYEVGVILRSFPALQQVPVVALTAYAMEGDRQRTLVAGCDGYIPKPIDGDRFPLQVAEFLRGKRERVDDREAPAYLRELNQRLVYRLVTQVEELKRLNQRVVQRAAEAESLVEAGRLLAGTLDLGEVLHRLAELVRRRFGTEAVVRIWLQADGAGTFVLQAQAGDTLVPAPARIRVVGGEGVLGWIVAHRRSLVVDDLRADPRIANQERVRNEGLVSFLGVPLLLDDQPVGILTVATREPQAFVREDVALVEALATSAAVAIRNARLWQQTQQRLRDTETLLAVSQAAGSVLDVAEIARRTLREMVHALGADLGGAWRRSEDGRHLVPTAGYHVPADLVEKVMSTPLALDAPLVAEVARAGRPLFLADSQQDPRGADHPLLSRLPHRSLLAVPMVVQGEVIGAFAVVWTRAGHQLTAEEERLAEAMARQAGIAIENARLLEAERAARAAQAALAAENARLFRETQERLRETEALLTVTRQLSSTLDPTETMRRVAREIARALGADMVGAYLADEAQTMLRPIAGYHVPRELYDRFLAHPIPIRGHAALEEVWRQRRPFWTDDAPGDGRLDAEAVARFPHQSLLFVPMTVKDGPIGGFFAVWWRDRRRFTAEEIRLVEGISDQAAMFIENARLYSEATRRRREAEELARLARMLTESLDAADVGERIVESALGLIGGAYAELRLLQSDGSLKLIASRGDAGLLADLPPVVPAGRGVVGRAAAEGRPVWSADVADQAAPEDADRADSPAAGVRAYLAVPLQVKREIIGVVGIGDRAPRAFSEAEVGLLGTFADQAAIALENSRLYGDLRAALRAVEESQQRIVQGERLRALGEMAGGVAHDFNNVLAIIVGRAEVLLNETQDPELQRQLSVIVKVALDAAQTVRRIQEFTRMRRSRPFQAVNLAQLIDEVVEVTRSRWKDEAQARGVRYEVVADARPTPAVAGDPAEIREALTNIVFNALDAMPEGGRLTLRTGTEDGRVVCVVSDTGIGMSEEVRQRIFDPFFTTKGERGTGLGLSVVYGIVSRHNAEVEVQSAPGAGSTFVLRFPPAPEGLGEAPARPVPRAPRRGRILVIDDEKEIAAVLADLLGRDGHQVVVATSGESGLERAAREAFDLVITDLGMPGISGWEVARLVKQLRPGTPVAMVTGWGDRIDPVEAAARGVDAVIPKPFKRDTVREAVSAVLRGAPAR